MTRARNKASDESLTKRKKGDPSLVQAVLSKVLTKYNLDQDFARYDFISKWGEIVGDEIAKRTRPECIRNNCLVVAVTSSAWAQELSFNREVILKRLQRHLSDPGVVNDVVFYVGAIGR